MPMLVGMGDIGVIGGQGEAFATPMEEHFTRHYS
jgi:hypothetical protein